jgi:hypothetical protein
MHITRPSLQHRPDSEIFRAAADHLNAGMRRLRLIAGHGTAQFDDARDQAEHDQLQALYQELLRRATDGRVHRRIESELLGIADELANDLETRCCCTTNHAHLLDQFRQTQSLLAAHTLEHTP